MDAGTPKLNEVSYVDSGASNHMTNNEEWFSHLRSGSNQVLLTRDDTSHGIEHLRDVPLSHIGLREIMRNVLHVSVITKNLVSVGQIVDQVRLTHHGCFIEDED